MTEGSSTPFPCTDLSYFTALLISIDIASKYNSRYNTKNLVVITLKPSIYVMASHSNIEFDVNCF